MKQCPFKLWAARQTRAYKLVNLMNDSFRDVGSNFILDWSRHSVNSLPLHLHPNQKRLLLVKLRLTSEARFDFEISVEPLSWSCRCPLSSQAAYTARIDQTGCMGTDHVENDLNLQYRIESSIYEDSVDWNYAAVLQQQNRGTAYLLIWTQSYCIISHSISKCFRRT